MCKAVRCGQHTCDVMRDVVASQFNNLRSGGERPKLPQNANTLHEKHTHIRHSICNTYYSRFTLCALSIRATTRAHESENRRIELKIHFVWYWHVITVEYWVRFDIDLLWSVLPPTIDIAISVRTAPCMDQQQHSCSHLTLAAVRFYFIFHFSFFTFSFYFVPSMIAFSSEWEHFQLDNVIFTTIQCRNVYAMWLSFVAKEVFKLNIIIMCYGFICPIGQRCMYSVLYMCVLWAGFMRVYERPVRTQYHKVPCAQ